MLSLRKTELEDLDHILALEQEPNTRQYILPYSRAQHEQAMAENNIIYLSIFDQTQFAGFIILANEPESEIGQSSVEFRRIVIGSKGKGLGQAAISAMEQYCRRELNATRVWLDVFSSNARGVHIYQKLGYQRFALDQVDGKELQLMEKSW